MNQPVKAVAGRHLQAMLNKQDFFPEEPTDAIEESAPREQYRSYMSGYLSR